MVADGKAEFIPKDEYETWLAPRQALAELSGMDSWYMMASAINDHLSRGFIRAAAKIVIQQHGGRSTNNRYVLVKSGLWEDAEPEADHPFWNTAKIVITSGGGYAGDTKTEFFGVRFDPEGIAGIKRDAGLAPQSSRAPYAPQKLPTQPQPANAASIQAKNKGGAPRKGWWDDLWIEMIRRIRAEELHPESGAQLQRIMLDWLADQGIYPGEETLKKTALKLFKYLQE
jgi:hypothetical protein